MRRRQLLAIVMGIVLPAAVIPAATNEVPSQSLLALEFLHGLYPELLDKSLSVRIDGAQPAFRLRVSETGGPDPSTPVLQLVTPLLSALLTLDSSSQVERYTAEGPFLQSQKLAALNRTLEAHPDWSDDERGAALRAAGAEYGPAREPDIESKVRPRAWEKQVGGGARIHLEGFSWKDPDRPAIGWRARLEAAGPDGRPRQYQLVIEPFTGRVISMIKLGQSGRVR